MFLFSIKINATERRVHICEVDSQLMKITVFALLICLSVGVNSLDTSFCPIRHHAKSVKTPHCLLLQCFNGHVIFCVSGIEIC